MRISKFDPSRLKEGETILIIGKRNTGKSIVTKNLLYHLQSKIDGAFIFSPTEALQGCLTTVVPPACIHEDFSDTTLTNVLECQHKQWSRGKGKQLYVVLDDCGYDEKSMKSKSLRKVFQNGRHNRLGCIVTLQHSMSIAPAVRANADWVFALREPIHSNRKRLYEHFFGIFPSFKSFKEVFQACTTNYSMLVLDNTTQSNSVSENIYYWRAESDLPDRCSH